MSRRTSPCSKPSWTIPATGWSAPSRPTRRCSRSSPRNSPCSILDIQMPGMTGFELAQMIKQRKKTAGVPIIFLTAYYNEDQHVLEGYGTGAVDYLHKPINPAVLRSKVAVFAELYQRKRESELVAKRTAAEVAERNAASRRTAG